jgi:hypothetical protein
VIPSASVILELGVVACAHRRPNDINALFIEQTI